MTITLEATYENGMLRPEQPLPLREHERVRITIDRPASVAEAVETVRRSYGLIRWTGDAKRAKGVRTYAVAFFLRRKCWQC
ncbi:MAG: antitoxin family protein [Planctomycetota bacterium]